MINNLKSIYSYFIFVSIVIILLSIIFFFATKKYNKKRIKLFALFASLNNRSIVLVSSFILNFTLVAFYACAPKYFGDFSLYLLIISTLISMIVSLDIKLIINNTVYTLISIFSLKIINLVYNYLTLIYYNRLTFILGIIFILMVLVFELFITFRLIEIVLKNKKFVGGLKKDGKSRKK